MEWDGEELVFQVILGNGVFDDARSQGHTETKDMSHSLR